LPAADGRDTIAPVGTSAHARSFGLSDRGHRRPHNEDAFAIDDTLGLYVVADGVGGHAKGEVASQESVEQVVGFVRQGRAQLDALRGDPSRSQHREVVRRLLESAVQNACYMVYGLAELDPAQKGMSTTISALLLVAGRAFVAQVGDSRVYRVRAGAAQQLTEDHTLLNYKLKQGLISEAEARTMKGKNVITRAVGHKDYVEVDTRDLDSQRGDVYVLCSDGITDVVRSAEIGTFVDVMARARALDGPYRIAKALVSLANARGGKDNATAVVVSVR